MLKNLAKIQTTAAKPLCSADMAELADALDLGSSVNRRAGSTPVIRIIRTYLNIPENKGSFDYISKGLS